MDFRTCAKDLTAASAMTKILVCLLIATAAETIASRHARSPDGSGWQGTNNFGEQPAFGAARSSVTSWSGFGNGLSQASAGDGSRGGWRGARFGFGSHDLGLQGKPSRKPYATHSDGSSTRFRGATTSWQNGAIARSSNVNDVSANTDYYSGWDNSRQANENNYW